MLRTKSNIVISKSKKNTHHPQYNFDVDDKKKLYRADIYNPIPYKIQQRPQQYEL